MGHKVADVVDISVYCIPEVAVGDAPSLPPLLHEMPTMRNPVTPQRLLAKMDGAGIAVAIIPACAYGDYWRLDPNVVEEFCAVAPERLIPIMGVNPHDGSRGVRELERYVGEHGFAGAHVHSSWAGLDIDDRLFYPYYASLSDLGVPLQIVCTVTKAMRAHVSPLQIEQIACDFPDLAIIATHSGFPWERELVAIAECHQNLFIGLDSVHPGDWSPEIVSRLHAERVSGPSGVGDFSGAAGKMMFGSGSLAPDDVLTSIEAHGFGAGVLKEVLSGNARSVYGI